ncbi:LysR family transcriptional regulator [Erythrobacter arachoides]|uniref:LysR family transcriptional regulator n=1 Tax=Aurantiacibacter arachoides TaxID=1850444 RepID=A0A844ZYV0_9SPHN|nr:LysR family transcriptional regulator [Aurantiacibacter arachoides]MXO92634.1 LysR family transcriptional regulator [Aurantiacibacter arachoides]GGD55587.1 transcriptional regulator [Aurantiacibacter arachoides]
MRFQRLDLNLLVALDALLTEQSVSLAADRLCLSQSATSSALGRLREYFEDDLLVLKGRQMVLTTRAEELIEPTRAVLEQIRQTIAVAPEFDHATSDRTIRFMASDYTTEVLLAPAMQHFAVAAPEMRFEIQHMGSAPVESLERGSVDLLVTVDFATSADHPSELMFEDDYVVVGDAGNPAMDEEMTSELYLSLPHVTVRFGKARIPAFDDWYMRRKKRQRRIEVVTASFVTMPALIVGTRRIATMHRRLAEKLGRRYPLRFAEVPFEIPPVREVAQWDVASSNDAALRWVVGELKKVAEAEVPAKPAQGYRPQGPHDDAIAFHFLQNAPVR